MGWDPFAKKAARDRELDAELSFHIDQRIADNIASGMAPDEARRRALMEFSTVDRVKEEVRDLHWETVVEGFYRDLRYTLRTLMKDRRFTPLAVLALALGIGAATVIFSAFYGVILNTFAFKNADQVTAFYIVDQEHPRNTRPNLTLPELVYFREHNHTFQDISGEFGGFGSTPLRTLFGAGTVQFDGAYLSASSFDMFGMTPLLGRLPNENDVKSGATPVFVIGAKLWRETFNSDPSIVGKTFVLNGVPRTLVGIMPPRFRWAWVDAWLPFSLDQNEIANNPELKGQWAYVVGRLKPGATVEQAAADLNLVAHAYARIEPRLYPQRFAVTAKRSSQQAVEGLGFAQLLYPLMYAVGLLLLIACANVANLLLARATVRAREISVRSALGASRGRLLRQFLVESLCLAFAGCLAGCFLAYVGIKVLRPLIPYNQFPQEAVIELDWQVLLFSISMAVLSTVICGMAPALHALRRDIRSGLSGTGASTGTGAAHGKLRSGLVIVEVALSVILLVASGLMMHRFVQVERTDLGINPHGLVFAGLSFPPTIKQTPEQQRLVFERFFNKLRSLPGVTSVSSTVTQPPFAGPGSDITIPGKVHTQRWMTALELCNENYLATLQGRLLRGRFLSETDVVGARRVAVVNQEFVDQYLAGENPIGRTVKFNRFDQVPALKDQFFEIVGVVGNTKNQGMSRPTGPQVYLPHTIMWSGSTKFIARTAVKPEALLPDIRRIVWETDPSVALINATSLDDLLQKYMYATPEFEFITFTTLASIGLLLVLIGIFSVMAYTVALQTHEIGIRMALGAARNKVVAWVLRRGMKLVAFGMLIGLAGSMATNQILASRIQGIQSLDPWAYGSVLVLTLIAGAAACLAPAYRASKVDPLEAIRYE